MIRGITICVEYDDILKITLPRMLEVLDEVVVVTTESDIRTKQVCVDQNTTKVKVFETDAFYRDGATFNKGLALEEGFDFMGREGWILVLDADILFPNRRILMNTQLGHLNGGTLNPSYLYGVKRRILDDVTKYTEGMDWRVCPIRHTNVFTGYFQLFNASAKEMQQRPWYGVDWTHCGGCDEIFRLKWPREKCRTLGFLVLHLGPCDTNWFGRVSERADNIEMGDQKIRKASMDKMVTHSLWGQKDITGEP